MEEKRKVRLSKIKNGSLLKISAEGVEGSGLVGIDYVRKLLDSEITEPWGGVGRGF